MSFRKYEKIHRLGKEEVDGITQGAVLVQEKIDGANTSIWIKDGQLHLASRNQQITDGFNGFREYVEKHEGIQKLLIDFDLYGKRLYGEWLVPHTVQYDKEAFKHWYMYDIFTAKGTGYYHEPAHVTEIADKYDIKHPYNFGMFRNPTEDQLREYVGQSALGQRGEGIVLKNHKFINRFGDRCYAKIVHQDFLEDNAIVFNSNNKQSDAYEEMYIVNKWMQKPRLQKIIQKLQPEINERLDMKHIPRIIHTAYHDMITEEAWEIAKLDRQVDFKKLKGLAMKKAKLLFVEILNGSSIEG